LRKVICLAGKFGDKNDVSAGPVVKYAKAGAAKRPAFHAPLLAGSISKTRAKKRRGNAEFCAD